jgi:hypothetical protein
LGVFGALLVIRQLCARFRDAMIVLEFILECLFYTVCGWVGHVVVKAITFGRVELDWGTSSESVLTEWIGLVFVLVVVGSIAYLVHR